MSQRYKLRLGDGSIHLVDADGLRAGLGDGGAMVQTPGSYRWSPLRDFLAEEPALAAALSKPREGERPRDPAVPPPSDRVARPSVSDRPLVQTLADDPGATPAAAGGRKPSDADRFPILRLKPLDDRDVGPAVPGRGSGPVEDAGVEAVPQAPWRDRLGRGLFPVVAALGTLLSRSLDRLRTGQERQRPPLPPTEPAASSAARPSTPEPLRPPPPTRELPVLRFADVTEPTEAEDLYEGGGEEGASPFQTLWRWTKRSVVITGLAAGGLLAVLTWETWLPSVARLGQTVFIEIDRRVRSRAETEEPQSALLAVTQQLPQLAPETIRRLRSSRPGVALDPPEVFQLAGDAADRGRSALTPGEAKELKALQSELVRTLRPAEQRRVREYDQARSRRVVFAFENRRVLELYARGARALPPRRLERLQVLLGKAISAGLARPPEVAPWDVPSR